MTDGGEDVHEVHLPRAGVWRVGHGPDPYELRAPLPPEALNHPRAGNRFDSPFGDYSVLYFGTQLEACFGETLARFRPDPALAPLVAGEWSPQGFMLPGEIPANWRHRRLAVRVRAGDSAVFLDAESSTTRQTLAKRLAPLLAALSVADLDIAVIRGGDRRITRAISYWAWLQVTEVGEPRYAGVRYLSRLDTAWECWAIFDRTPTNELDRRAITREMPELQSVARLFGLTVF